MSALTRNRALEAELEALPENVVGEILFDRLVVQPRPALPHASAASAIGEMLGPPFRRGLGGPGGWLLLDEPEIRFGPHVLVPDVAGWRRESMPELPLVARTDVPPDWVCEVLSPGTETLDRTEKSLVYAANGVAHLWLVDPRVRSVEVHANERGRWTLVARAEGDAPGRLAPFDALELPLAWLWAR